MIKGVAKLRKILFPKHSTSTSGGFTIATFEPISNEEGKVEVSEDWGTFSMKGNMPSMKEGKEYYYFAEEGERHHQYGLSYDCKFIRENLTIDKSDKESVKMFLSSFLTERQVISLMDTFDNPIEIIENRDVKKLTDAKYIGKVLADKIVTKYLELADYSHAFVELGKFDIKPTTIRKIVDYYNSPELAVEKIKENPYSLMQIDGYGFKTCDKLFLTLGGEANSPLRIESFLTHILKEEANLGHTWISPLDLINKTINNIPSADKSLIGKMLIEKNDLFYLSEDKKRISLNLFHNMELKICSELKRLLEADNEFEYAGWEDIVKKGEKLQGWEYTSGQKDAMKMMFESNVCIVEGLSGTGKTTSLKVVLDILESNGFTYVQGAIAGKASNNLALVTGRDGVTIHRMLGVNPVTKKFIHNKKNPLPYDIIIIDEISMVDAVIFCHLLIAIRSGCKLIMLGDSEQLEAIGVSVFKDLIESKAIPRIMLTEIHRQAKKSAIVTHSIAVRHGKTPIKKETGKFERGELKDLEYIILEDEGDIHLNTMREFHKQIQTNNINDVQILCSTKNKGATNCLKLNRDCQKVYNPNNNKSKKEVIVGKLENDGYILREGDKVINTMNQYTAENEDGQVTPIYNGNIGILKAIETDSEGAEYILIDFDGIDTPIKIYNSNYKSIELAYCITCHKAQGMSIPITILPFPFNYMLNSKQLLYTAMTRAKFKCIILSTYRSVYNAVKKDSTTNKRTYLKDYLIESIKTKQLI